MWAVGTSAVVMWLVSTSCALVGPRGARPSFDCVRGFCKLKIHPIRRRNGTDEKPEIRLEPFAAGSRHYLLSGHRSAPADFLRRTRDRAAARCRNPSLHRHAADATDGREGLAHLALPGLRFKALAGVSENAGGLRTSRCDTLQILPTWRYARSPAHAYRMSTY